jgi:hypothetical protein
LSSFILFLISIAVHGIEVDTTVPLIGGTAKPAPEEEFLRMHPKKTLGELLCATDGGVVVVFAEVVGVVQGQDWWYPACRCHKSVSPDSGAYYCSSCNKHVFQVIPRFRVKLEVTDGKSNAVFVLFDSDMSYIMEKSCSFFVAQSKVADIFNWLCFFVRSVVASWWMVFNDCFLMFCTGH